VYDNVILGTTARGTLAPRLRHCQWPARRRGSASGPGWARQV